LSEHDGRLPIFAYVTAEKAARYRAVMGAFVTAKEQFRLHLGRPDVLDTLADDEQSPATAPIDLDETQALLTQLVEWGNLRADVDTAEVATVEEFNRPRFLYQLTAEGEAAERAIRHFDEAIRTPGELQTTALTDIRDLLRALLELTDREPDPAKVHRTLRALTDRFEELTDRAQTFIAGLQRTVDLHQVELDAFLAYKDRLIEYLERFIGELVVAQAEIAALLGRVEAAGSDRLLEIAATRDLEDALEVDEEGRAEALTRWRGRWRGLRTWFLPEPGQLSQSDVLRARAREAIPAMLLAVSQINERRVSRADRASDLRTLARWFAEAPTDGDAHRLWRAAFGLTSARHLAIDEETLDARDAAPVPPATSWLDADPIRVAPQLRRTGRYVRRGRPRSVIDRSREKALLAQRAAEEAAQTAAARQRLATDAPVRLSELGELDRDAFPLFLDLLGEALARKLRPDEEVEATTADGGLAIRLSPTRDGTTATIRTTDGVLRGPDHHVEIIDLLATPTLAEVAS
jgi:uncharacterized protein (TIGR02677 family)